MITGHCALYGSETGRLRLSRRRVENVVAFFHENGWSPAMAPEIVGHAGKDPVTVKAAEQNLNRRVEITF